MSSSNKIPTEQKLAGVITGFVSLMFLSLLFFYNIVIPVHHEITKPVSGTTEISYINEEETVSDDSKSLSSTLPSGITASVVKIETELFRNSFISSFERSNKALSSTTNSSQSTEVPGKAPNTGFGQEKSVTNYLKETNLVGGNLTNRKLLFIDKAKGTNEEGSVVIRLTVNPKGEVINAEVDPARTSSTSASLRSKSLETASTAVFEPSALTEDQTGFITFKFEY